MSTIINELSYAEWDEIERVIMTRQYGVFDQYIIDVTNTRILSNWFEKLHSKIECIRRHNNTYVGTACQREEVNYHHYVQHDITIIALLNLFDLEQQWKLIRYAATVILELHLDDNCTADTEECLSVKIFFN
jgi:hypothetical protein